MAIESWPDPFGLPTKPAFKKGDVSTFSCFQINLEPGREDLCYEAAIKELRERYGDFVVLRGPCGHAHGYDNFENFPKEDVRCPNSGKCGAEECFIIRFIGDTKCI